jgi:CRP-like cAMP-binding protein
MNQSQKRKFLTDHFAFENLPSADVDYLADNARTRNLNGGETVFFKDDPPTGMIAIISGGVQIQTVSEDGKELHLNTLGPGEMFGEIGAIDGGERTADAIAIERSKLLFIDRRYFLDVVMRNPKFCINLMALLCSRIRAISEQVEDFAFLELKTRLAKKLVALAEMRNDDDADNGNIVLRMSQMEVGTMLGTTREAINKHLNLWAKDGLISLGRNEIIIHDLEDLRRVFDI